MTYDESDLESSYDEGYECGKSDGYDEGYRSALKECTDDIEERGYKEGYQTAKEKYENEICKLERNFDDIIEDYKYQIKVLKENNIQRKCNATTTQFI